jgi:hypothetical protein
MTNYIMLKLFNHYSFLVVFFFACAPLFAQSDFEGNTRILSKHIKAEKLEEIKNTSSEVYNKIMYYFYASFEVSNLNCDTCAIDKTKLFNVHLFDVSEFEDQRLQNEAVTIVFKQRFTITLHSLTQVDDQLDGKSIAELLAHTNPRPFPVWEEVTGDDDQDYTLYKERVYDWARDFPFQYRALTNSPDLFKLSIQNFKALTSSRREMVLNMDSYLIID